MTEQKIWLITGISSGFGRCLAEEVIKAGDIVIGTLRKQEQVEQFNREFIGKASAIRMDVTQRADIEGGIRLAIERHQRIDVLVNNAGYGLFGAVEEASGQEVRDQMETNFFGALAMTQAVLPHMRKRKSGHVVQISSIAGLRGTPGLGIYNASKFALEGFSEALALEVAPLGITVTLVEPGPFRTHWAGGSAKVAARNIKDYEGTAHATIKQIQGYNGTQPGDPAKAAKTIIRAVNSPKPPLHLPLGQIAIERAREKIRNLEQDIAAWEEASLKTAFAA